MAELASKLGKEGAIRIGPPAHGAMKRGKISCENSVINDDE